MKIKPEYTLTREQAIKEAGLRDIIEEETGSQLRLYPDGLRVSFQWRSYCTNKWNSGEYWFLNEDSKYRVIKAEKPKRYMKDLSELETPGLKGIKITYPKGEVVELLLRALCGPEYTHIAAALTHGWPVEMIFEGDA